MKKLKLQIEKLSVQSFPTETVEDGQGTVQGNMPPQPRTLDPAWFTCNPYFHTCYNASAMWTYCGDPCSDTAPQYATCYDTCHWP